MQEVVRVCVPYENLTCKILCTSLRGGCIIPARFMKMSFYPRREDVVVKVTRFRYRCDHF